MPITPAREITTAQEGIVTQTCCVFLWHHQWLLMMYQSLERLSNCRGKCISTTTPCNSVPRGKGHSKKKCRGNNKEMGLSQSVIAFSYFWLWVSKGEAWLTYNCQPFYLFYEITPSFSPTMLWVPFELLEVKYWVFFVFMTSKLNHIQSYISISYHHPLVSHHN